MRYKIQKEGCFWYGYEYLCWFHDWRYIIGSVSFTKTGCKYAIKKYHKQFNKNSKIKYEEEFELD